MSAFSTYALKHDIPTKSYRNIKNILHNIMRKVNWYKYIPCVLALCDCMYLYNSVHVFITKKNVLWETGREMLKWKIRSKFLLQRSCCWKTHWRDGTEEKKYENLYRVPGACREFRTNSHKLFIDYWNIFTSPHSTKSYFVIFCVDTYVILKKHYCRIE